MKDWVHIFNHTESQVVLGILVGFCARIMMLRLDYRQYPTQPHGYIIHLSLGLIAAGLGAVAVPALIARDWTAITFLSLAAQQFREVRNMERNTLKNLDGMELVPRGNTYIEGIAMVFEGRNYLVILTAFVTTIVAVVAGFFWGLAAGILALGIDKLLMSGKNISTILQVSEGTLHFKGANLFVDDIHIMNIGLKESQELILQQGLGFILTPINDNSIVTLANLGQRQAILHDLSTILGVYRDSGTPSFVPLSKRNLDDGRLAIFLLPQSKDMKRAMEAIKRVPLLENAVRQAKRA
ncbi:YIEGIA family protein [Rubeoparvulum massiliense]|uniref:YIEGIA family protein n=1 Tax=Rubeoparvulum massiliense TaxID=1631346 RepID=UPI00065E2EDB|nr:YIEGIA family protein [Rubeoparvulum massiliense]